MILDFLIGTLLKDTLRYPKRYFAAGIAVFIFLYWILLFLMVNSLK